MSAKNLLRIKITLTKTQSQSYPRFRKRLLCLKEPLTEGQVRNHRK